MAGFQGADTAQLRTLAQKMQVQSGRLEELRSRIDPLVRNEGSWTGPDAESFRASWAQTGPSMAHATQSLTGRAKDLIRQADEQDKASEATAIGQCGAPQGAHDKGFWGRVGDGVKGFVKAYNEAQSLFSAGKKVWDVAKIVRNGRAMLKGAASLNDPLMMRLGLQFYGNELAKKAFSGGKEFSALASKIAGKVGLPTGAGLKSFFSWVDTAVAEKAPNLLKGAKFLGPALSLVDTVWSGVDSVNAFKSGDTFTGFTKAGQSIGAGLMTAGGLMSATGIGAPVGGVLLAAGAVINLGSLAVETIHKHWDQIEGASKAAWDWTTDRFNDAATTISDGVDNVKNAVSDGAKKFGDGVASFGRKLGFGW